MPDTRPSGLPLVVGGAGFIGSALVRELANEGVVRVLDDLSTGHRRNLEGVPQVDLVEGSILDDDAVVSALRDVSVVYNLACLGVRHSIAKPFANHEVNALGTLKLLDLCRGEQVDRVVHVSTSEVYGTAEFVPMSEDHPTWPHTVYGAAKLAGEGYARAYHVTYGLPTVVIRPFNAFGPRSHHEGDSGEVIPKFLLRAINGLPPVIFGDGSQTRDFTYVEDTARALRAAGRVEAAIGKTINVGSNQELSVNELAEVVLRLTGRMDLCPERQPSRPGDVLRLYSDSTRAHKLLDWKAETTIDEGIGRLLNWHSEQGTDWGAALSEDVPRNWEPLSTGTHQ